MSAFKFGKETMAAYDNFLTSQKEFMREWGNFDEANEEEFKRLDAIRIRYNADVVELKKLLRFEAGQAEKEGTKKLELGPLSVVTPHTTKFEAEKFYAAIFKVGGDAAIKARFKTDKGALKAKKEAPQLYEEVFKNGGEALAQQAFDEGALRQVVQADQDKIEGWAMKNGLKAALDACMVTEAQTPRVTAPGEIPPFGQPYKGK